MKTIQTMGPNRPKGGEWARETALGAVTPPVRISGTVLLLLNGVFERLCLFSVRFSFPQPWQRQLLKTVICVIMCIRMICICIKDKRL